MGILIQRVSNAGVVCENFLTNLTAQGKSAAQNKPIAWLLPDYDRALNRRKQLATSGSELRLGCTVSMFTAWVDDLWALYGDGRLVISAIQRKLLVQRVLLDAAETGDLLFEPSSGTVNLLCRMVQQGFGLDPFVGAMREGGAGLSETHQAMLLVAAKYGELLEQANLCERSEAMSLLLEADELEWPVLACEGFASLSPSEASFFAKLSDRTDVLFAVEVPSGSSFAAEAQLADSLRRFGAQVGCAIGEESGAQVNCLAREKSNAFENRANELTRLSALLYGEAAADGLEPTGALKALLPSGRYALPAMLADEICESRGSVLVACNKPAEMFEELAARLGSHGISVEASYMKSFEETDFGRTLLNAYQLFKGDRFDVAQASDFTISQLSEKGPRGIYALDAEWRSKRLTDADKVEGDLSKVEDDPSSGEGDPVGSFARLIGEGRIEEAITLAEERYLDLPYHKDFVKAEQLAAIKCARSVLEQANCLGGNFEDALDLLYGIKVGVRVQSIADDGSKPRVRVASYYDAAQLAEASFDIVFACNLNASEQPLKVQRTSLDGLLDALSVSVPRDALFETRLRMLNVVGAAKSKLYLVRTLNDADAAPLYPAVAFEEISSCYAGKADKLTGLAESLVRGGHFSHRGEEYLEENLGKAPFVGEEVLSPGRVAEVSEGMAGVLLEPVRHFSASAIEAYLDCPYKWFASRRLRLAHLDAAFTALEKGSFFHEVLNDFYREYRTAFGKGKPEPTDESLAAAKPLFNAVFNAVAERQPDKQPRENPLIPLTQSEHRQMEELRAQLFGFIERDAKLLPGFVPTYFECGFGVDEPVEYAGVTIKGSIDRIDVDDQGRIAVIDYKSSLGDSYHLVSSSKDDEDACLRVLPAKVQALIYAQVARRLLAKQPVAALYVHALRPGSQPQVCGAFDDFVLGPDDIPGIKTARNAVSKSGWGSFSELLDGVEAAIGERLEELKAAKIPVMPRDEKSCGFCPVLECEGRK